MHVPVGGFGGELLSSVCGVLLVVGGQQVLMSGTASSGQSEWGLSEGGVTTM